QYQKYAVESGAYVREHFWGADPRLLDMVKHLSDDQLKKMTLGGHDPIKVYNAYKVAVEHKGAPTVILARTIKGYGLGEAGEGKNITHQQKKMNEEELRAFRTRFGIPVSDTEIGKTPFYRPPDDSIEIKYMRQRREALGGYVPSRRNRSTPLKRVPPELFEEFYKGTEGRKASTTMVFVRMLSKLLRDETLGPLVVPIVPAESRTRGFMLGGTSGRTTLAGEGLQHQDGNSHLFAMAYPNCVAYDPAFAYEIAVIIQDGIRRMYIDQESIFYYLTVMNEQYAM